MTNSTEYVVALKHLHLPGFIKICMTTTPPEQHARELSASNLLPGSFEILCALETNDAPNIEGDLHRVFASHRVKDGDLFEVDAGAVTAAFHLAQYGAMRHGQSQGARPDLQPYPHGQDDRVAVASVPLNDAREAYVHWREGGDDQ